ncbi:PH domain-containing protein [Tranquillimonas alkanivorans]|uniref:PH domain-containing protein n=1 Tax=Tranquillimonas alkanivorans TaxID=441119 RepID=A0A1I5MAF2_9RHOB|nr:PH domain-containing protein [Tranquillimonas alkanivorans]SFP06564.1 PH domain-containing protein [Tranquillimonas alkanivorans]
MAEPLAFSRSGRAPGAVALLALTLGGAAAAALLLDAAWWVVSALVAVSLPSLLDVAHGRAAWLRLDDDRIAWRSGGRTGDVPLSRIRAARLRVAFDLSQRCVLTLEDGTQARIPPDCVPPGLTLQHALEARGIPTARAILRP